MTREEHLKWCKQRAIEEMDYSGLPSQAIISMMSDFRKHPEFNSDSLQQLCLFQLISKPNMTRQEAINFINGFN